MLEVLFDDEKIFSVLREILHANNADDINVARICYDLKLSAEATSNIIVKLEFLDFIKNNDNDFESVESFSLNTDSELLFILCLFDDIVGEFVKDKTTKENKENGNFKDMLRHVDIDKISLKDFIDLVQKID